MAIHILHIEDDPDIRDLVRLVMQPKGYVIHETGDGLIGMNMIGEVEPDLIILDLMLPSMSGIEIARRLQADPELRDIPVIVTSAISNESQRPEEFWRQGLRVDEFMSKATFTPIDLLGRVEYLLRRDTYRKPSAYEPQEEIAEPVDLTISPPELVVRYFIEAANSQDFDLEFRCLSEKMAGGVSQEEYVRRRKMVAQNGSPDSGARHLREVFDIHNDGRHARIKVKRDEQKETRIVTEDQTYRLEHYDDGWRITHVRTV